MGIVPGPGDRVSKVVDEIRRFAARHPLDGPGVVAVSGGADSVALLRGLHEAGFAPLTVAHLNHQLRGDESDADEGFVRELAGRLGVPWRVRAVDVAAVAGRQRDNVEAVARRERYEWFAAVARDAGAGWVATGHSADDQAETVLHRFLRGTGIQGLRGIAASRPLTPQPPLPQRGEGEQESALPSPPRVLERVGEGPGVRAVSLVRPLLAVTRADVLAYLADLGQPHREDSSNADVTIARNRIRRQLLPILRRYSPAVATLLGRLAHQAEEVFALVDAQASTWLWECERPRAGGTVVLDANTATMMPDALLREVIRKVWQREGWPANGMTFDHWDRAARVVRGEVPAADFPGGVRVRHTGRVVQLGRRA